MGWTTRHGSAVVAGKFLPFHKGHEALIRFATKQAETVHVLLVANDEIDIYPPAQRALSIYESFPYSNIRVHIVDDIYTDDNTPEASKMWARYTKAILGFTPGIVVASEDYGVTWAKEMGCEFAMFDPDRHMIPVSGTLCRENAAKMSDYLPPATKRYTLPRVVVVGAESTGTTTLTKALAVKYDTVWVPELGHELGFEALAAGESVADDSWTDQRFLLVSRGQDAQEERMARVANRVLFCDTDSWATSFWYTYYMKKGVLNNPDTLGRLSKAGNRQKAKHALYIVTSPEGVPFEDDGTRTGEHLREWMHDCFVDALEYSPDGIPYIVVTGTPEERLAQASEAIDRLLDKAQAPMVYS